MSCGGLLLQVIEVLHLDRQLGGYDCVCFKGKMGGEGYMLGRTRGCEFVCVCERGAGSCKHTAIREDYPAQCP